MRQSGMRRLLYLVFAFIALAYTFVGLFISLNAGGGASGAAFEANYEIGNSPILMGLFIVVTGIPVFLLFLFLERRASRNSAPKN